MSNSKGFIDDLVGSMPTPHSRMVCLAVLNKWAGEQIYLPTQSQGPRRAQAASNMLAEGMTDADIAQALRRRFNISARTAWRDVQDARKMSKKNGTNAEDI